MGVGLGLGLGLGLDRTPVPAAAPSTAPAAVATAGCAPRRVATPASAAASIVDAPDAFIACSPVEAFSVPVFAADAADEAAVAAFSLRPATRTGALADATAYVALALADATSYVALALADATSYVELAALRPERRSPAP